MNTAIMGTKTVEEYKKLRFLMQQRANECYKKHKQAFEVWREGDIQKVWIDKDGNLCIEYESGKWWHYNDKCEWW